MNNRVLSPSPGLASRKLIGKDRRGADLTIRSRYPNLLKQRPEERLMQGTFMPADVLNTTRIRV